MPNTTGKGSFPYKNRSWIYRRINKPLNKLILLKNLHPSDTTNTESVVWGDWFFPSTNPTTRRRVMFIQTER